MQNHPQRRRRQEPDDPLSTDPTARARLRWSAATSSVQIEGSRRADGAGRSIWDDEIAKPGRIRDGSTAEPACDSYRRVEDDVALAAGLGLDRYRFSIPWARVQPDGHGPGNVPALDHYARVVDGLLAAGVTPFPTLYHWELPSAVEADGGWLARDTAERFGEYAALVAARLGDRVSSWYTLNEPAMTTLQGYAVGALAPGRQLLFGALPTVHHQLLAHSRAAEALHARGAASVGLVNNHTWVLPLRDTEEDRTAAAVYDLLHNRLFSEPLLSGTTPHLEALGLPPLPILGDDLARIAGSIDFYGVNFYNPTTVTAGAPDADIPFEIVPTPGVPVTGFGPEWPIMPSALRDLLIDLHRRHPDMPPIIIGENGASFPNPTSPVPSRMPTGSPTSPRTSTRWARPSMPASRSRSTRSGPCSTTGNGRTATLSGSVSCTWTSRRGAHSEGFLRVVPRPRRRRS